MQKNKELFQEFFPKYARFEYRGNDSYYDKSKKEIKQAIEVLKKVTKRKWEFWK